MAKKKTAKRSKAAPLAYVGQSKCWQIGPVDQTKERETVVLYLEPAMARKLGESLCRLHSAKQGDCPDDADVYLTAYRTTGQITVGWRAKPVAAPHARHADVRRR